MFARVTNTQVDLNKFVETIGIYRDSVIPAAKSQKGYKGAYLLTDRKTGKGIGMTLWDSEADAIADEESGKFQERRSWFSDFFAAPPGREGYEVNAQG